MEASFLNPNMEVSIYIEYPEDIADLGIITKEFLEEYCILLGKSMYGNFDAALFWLILLAEYLVNKINLKVTRQTPVFSLGYK